MELESVQKSLSFLKQAEGPFVLLPADEVQCALIELVKDDRHLVLVEIQLLAVHLLEGVIETPGAGRLLHVRFVRVGKELLRSTEGARVWRRLLAH